MRDLYITLSVFETKQRLGISVEEIHDYIRARCAYSRIAVDSCWWNRTVGLEDSENLVTWDIVSFMFEEIGLKKFHIPVTTLTWATPWLSRRTTPI